MPRRSKLIALSLLAVLALAGCKKDSPREGGGSDSASLRKGGVTPNAAAANVTARIHMTGLLLIVSPKDSGATTVYFPTPSTAHYARFGFRYRKSDADLAKLCLSDSDAPGSSGANLCYVDLSAWSLERIGNTPASTKHVDFERFGVLNVTHVSGGKHKVDPAAIGSSVSTRLQLLNGGPIDSCSLGHWEYQPISAAGAVQAARQTPLANKIEWEMELPSSYTLEFKERSPGTRVIQVPIFPDSGHVDFVLAHLMKDELADLPPGGYGTAVEPTNLDAKDFAAFYSALGVPRNRRPIPRYVRGTLSPRSCVITIGPRAGTWGDTAAAVGDTIVGIKTFACLPGAADPVP